jgi:hypothetical protein
VSKPSFHEAEQGETRYAAVFNLDIFDEPADNNRCMNDVTPARDVCVTANAQISASVRNLLSVPQDILQRAVGCKYRTSAVAWECKFLISNNFSLN